MSGAIVIRRQDRYLEALAEAGATSPEAARTLDELDLSDSLILKTLVSRGVVREMPEGRYWVDLDAVDAFLLSRRKRVLIAVGLGVVFALVLAFVS